jgi:DNA-binding transcriptional ArsR family regulator
MRTMNGARVTTIALAMLLAAPFLAALPAVAGSDNEAGTFVLDLTIHTPVADIPLGPTPGITTVVLPNPAYDAFLAARPLAQAAGVPVILADEEEGVYLLASDGAPVRVIGWSPGLEQRRLAPVEFAVHALESEDSLPVGVDGCACLPQPDSLTFNGIIAPAQDVLEPASASAGLPAPAPRLPADEAAPVPTVSETLGTSPESYHAPLARPAHESLASEAALANPLPGDGSPALAAAVAAGLALLLAKLLLPLYHRFKRKTALDNPTRQRLYELLRDAPGSSAAQLSEQAGLHVTTVKYHLDVLRRVGMVGEQVVDGCRRFYSYENGDRMELLCRALLDEPAARAIYRQISEHPGLPFIEVAKSLGMRKEHVHYHVQKLTKHGLVADRWEGGRRLLFPSVPPAVAPAPAPMPPAVAPVAPPVLEPAKDAPTPQPATPGVRA